MTASDIFSTTISSLVPVYLSAAVWPAIMIAARFRFLQHPNLASAIDSIDNVEIRQKQHQSARSIRIFLLLFSIVSAAAIVSLQIYMSHHGKSFNYMIAGFAVVIPTAILAFIFLEKAPTSTATDEIVVLLISLLISAVSSGLDAGQRARYAEYHESYMTLPRCNSSALMRKISDYYLVVKPDGTKALASSDCSDKFYIPEPF